MSVLRISTVNRLVRPLGVKLQRGDGYFYWLDLRGGLVLDAESVMVFGVNQLTLEQWWKEALAASKKLD